MDNNESNEILSTHELAEQQWDGYSEPGDVDTDMAATNRPDREGIEFHVSMRNYTMRDMEELIIEAAARKMLASFGDQKLSKLIEDRAINLVTAKADDALQSVSAEIINQPLTPDFGQRDPVTMRDFIGLTGREYLTQPVGTDGKPSKGYNTRPRIQRIVEGWMDRAFKAEIEKATTQVIGEVRSAIKKQHEDMLATEKARVMDALKHSLGEKQ